MDKLCGNETFWDLQQTWNGTWPEFSTCFINTVLAWTPCLLLWISAIVYIPWLRKNEVAPLARGWLFWAKQISGGLLILLQIITLLDAISRSVNSYKSSPPIAQFLAPLARLVTMVLVMLLVSMETKKGVLSSLVLFLYWTLTVIADVVPFYTVIIEQETLTYLVRSVTFYLAFALEVFQLILHCFANKTHSGDKGDPESSAPFPSWITYSWMSSLMSRGFKQELRKDDVSDLKSSDKSETVSRSFFTNWRREQTHRSWKRSQDEERTAQRCTKKILKSPPEIDERTPLLSSSSRRRNSGHHIHFNTKESRVDVHLEPSDNEKEEDKEKNQVTLCKALVRTFLWSWVVSNFWKLPHDMLLLLNPLLLGVIIEMSEDNSGPSWRGYILVVGLGVSILLQGLLFQLTFHLSMTLGLRIKSAVTAAIFRKVLTVSSEGRRKSPEGEIINLVSVDAQHVNVFVSYFPYAWSGPVQIALSVFFLYRTVGMAAFVGAGVLVLLLPVNAWLLARLGKYQTTLMEHKDSRLKLLTDVLAAIKTIKVYAWEEPFSDHVTRARERELSVLWSVALLDASQTILWTLAPVLMSFLTFAVHVFTGADHRVTPSEAFVTLGYLNIMRGAVTVAPMVLTDIVKAGVSLRRIERFLCQDDLDPSVVIRDPNQEEAVVVKSASFSWEKGWRPCLHNISLTIPEGSLVAVVGAVGSGKSSLLAAILGEMHAINGHVTVNCEASYVPQQPWLRQTTFRANIQGYDRRLNMTRYKAAIRTCALTSDLAAMAGGDLTQIGDRGVTLSGGQRQRVNIARAVYESRDLYLMDDPISAVDNRVGNHIFHLLIGQNGLIRDATRIVTTSTYHWLPEADIIIVLSEGKIVENGTYCELMSRDGHLVRLLTTSNSVHGQMTPVTTVPDLLGGISSRGFTPQEVSSRHETTREDSGSHDKESLPDRDDLRLSVGSAQAGEKQAPVQRHRLYKTKAESARLCTITVQKQRRKGISMCPLIITRFGNGCPAQGTELRPEERCSEDSSPVSPVTPPTHFPFTSIVSSIHASGGHNGATWIEPQESPPQTTESSGQTTLNGNSVNADVEVHRVESKPVSENPQDCRVTVNESRSSIETGGALRGAHSTASDDSTGTETQRAKSDIEESYITTEDIKSIDLVGSFGFDVRGNGSVYTSSSTVTVTTDDGEEADTEAESGNVSNIRRAKLARAESVHCWPEDALPAEPLSSKHHGVDHSNPVRRDTRVSCADQEDSQDMKTEHFEAKTAENKEKETASSCFDFDPFNPIAPQLSGGSGGTDGDDLRGTANSDYRTAEYTEHETTSLCQMSTYVDTAQTSLVAESSCSFHAQASERWDEQMNSSGEHSCTDASTEALVSTAVLCDTDDARTLDKNKQQTTPTPYDHTDLCTAVATKTLVTNVSECHAVHFPKEEKTGFPDCNREDPTKDTVTDSEVYFTSHEQSQEQSSQSEEQTSLTCTLRSYTDRYNPPQQSADQPQHTLLDDCCELHSGRHTPPDSHALTETLRGHHSHGDSFSGHHSFGGTYSGHHGLRDTYSGRHGLLETMSVMSCERSARGRLQPAPLIDEEHVFVGKVRCEVYMAVLRSLGTAYSILVLALYVMYHVTSVCANLWLSHWTDDSALSNLTRLPPDSATRQRQNAAYVGVYGALGAGQCLFVVVYALLLAARRVHASRAMHTNMLKCILCAPLHFFNRNPAARVLSRMSRDLEVIDTEIWLVVEVVLESACHVISTCVVVSVTTPYYLIALMPIGLVYYLVQKYYVATSRQLRRLESKTRSPVFTHLSETFSGAPVLRAAGSKVTEHALQEAADLVDNNFKFSFYSNTATRWLGVRMSAVGVFVVGLAGSLAVTLRRSLSGGMVGVSVSYALDVTENLNWLVRMTGDLETNAVSVERILEYSHIKSEAEGFPTLVPTSLWPEQGSVQFLKVSARYADDAPFVLKNIDCTIRPREKIGVVGRTGAGKTSLWAVMVGLLKPEEGAVIIDDVDTRTVPLHVLRMRVAVMPQEPVIFEGSLRMNLDPSGTLGDERLWSVLRQTRLASHVHSLPGLLGYHCESGGPSLSGGQRQLLCLARMLLRHARVLILDEATASTDRETDDVIQHTLQHACADCTVFIIAHRLSSVMQCDRVMVMDQGRLVEMDSPARLLSDPTSMFSRLAASANLTK